ncbi:uncharacterized protein Dana_GF21875 [Drosophila ananassae]|uniref:Pickpocket protein 11 n=2 Tax=Drosophila ananassae TaxID=7217 RepID=B3MUZ4_DROAN|nr:uncharacterized protein Dana_GF21875 [Drosophila ananassae]
MSAPKTTEDTPPPLVYLVNFENYLKPKHSTKCQPLQRFEKPIGKVSRITRNLKRLKLIRWYYSASQRFGQLPLPKFLEFLRARNDDGLCKRKTGFEIYCEMASIHGFHIFVGAKTWQRILWWLLICTAVLLSLLIVTMSLSMSNERPTMRSITTMMKPSSEVPFPAITICAFEMFPLTRLRSKSKEWGVPPEMLWNLNFTSLQPLISKNISWKNVLEELATPMCNQIQRCEWDSPLRNCTDKLTALWTLDQRLCCSFNHQQQLFSSHLGLTLALNQGCPVPPTNNSFGYEVLVHDSYEIPTEMTSRLLVSSGSVAHIMVQPFVNRITPSLAQISVGMRGCYLQKEHSRLSSSVYSQINCLAESRSEEIHKSCDCVPPHYPSRSGWKVCDLEQLHCVRECENNEKFKEEQARWNCLPPCQFNRYEFQSDIQILKSMENLSNASQPNHRSQQVLLRVYYDSPMAEEIVLDVYENWLTFIGTFGGITGLFMGCSFVSVFELIFFSCVRPTCNWLTRQQIMWRRRRRQRVGQANEVVRRAN